MADAEVAVWKSLHTKRKSYFFVQSLLLTLQDGRCFWFISATTPPGMTSLFTKHFME